jgi:hypothetical protein
MPTYNPNEIYKYSNLPIYKRLEVRMSLQAKPTVDAYAWESGIKAIFSIHIIKTVGADLRNGLAE